jgi:hypothetical protein
MKLKLTANDMRITAEEHVIRSTGVRPPDCCQRSMVVDNHNVTFVLTLREVREGGRKQRHWHLTVCEDNRNVLPERIMHRVLNAFFGHADFADEPPHDDDSAGEWADSIRTFRALYPTKQAA